MQHTISTVEQTATSLTRECSCGWVTIGETPEPAHHTPLVQREADHLREAAAIADGSVWQQVPDRHTYELQLRRRLRDRTPNQVAVVAIWQGGFQTVLIWPWNAEGLAAAQEWCDTHPTWLKDWPGTRLVDPGSLARHVNAI